MSSEMKNARTPVEETPANITKCVSMPKDMWSAVEARVNADPELDFSKYVRRLIRRDVLIGRGKKGAA